MDKFYTISYSITTDNDLGIICIAKEDIFSLLHKGTKLYEVEPIGGVMYAHRANWALKYNIKYIGNILEYIPFLVEQGANINEIKQDTLYDSIKGGYINTVKLLVEKCPNIFINKDYGNALQLAVSYEYFEIVKYLVEKGANIHYNNDLVFRTSASHGYLKILKYLVKNGANIHAMDDDALRRAIINCHINVVKYLSERGAIISEKVLLSYYSENYSQKREVIIEYLRKKKKIIEDKIQQP